MDVTESHFNQPAKAGESAAAEVQVRITQTLSPIFTGYYSITRDFWGSRPRLYAYARYRGLRSHLLRRIFE